MGVANRHHRLQEEERILAGYRNPHVHIQPVGSRKPCEEYLLTFHSKSVIDPDMRLGDRHLVTMRMPGGFPADPPAIFVTTPVWHPNVYDTGLVCLGAEFWRPTLDLDLCIAQVGRILEYQNFSCEDRANIDWGLERWKEWIAELERRHGLPLGNTVFTDLADLDAPRKPLEIQLVARKIEAAPDIQVARKPVEPIVIDVRRPASNEIFVRRRSAADVPDIRVTRRTQG